MISDRIEPASGIASNTLPSSRRTVAQEIETLGWSRTARIDCPDEDLSITCLDAWPVKDGVFSAEGPATLSIAVFREGKGSVIVDGGEPLEICPGRAVVFSSEGPVRGENRVCGGSPVKLIDIRFERGFAARLGDFPIVGSGSLVNCSIPKRGIMLLGFPAPRRLLEIARQIEGCLFDDPMARRLYLRAKGLEALAVVIDFLAAKPRGMKPARLHDRDHVARARYLLETRFDERWTIPILARTIGLSEGKLKADFRRDVGTSIHAYLLCVRLDAAAALLMEGASVTESAYATGFSNLSHFSKIFRHVKGTSPQDYGKRHSRTSVTCQDC